MARVRVQIPVDPSVGQPPVVTPEQAPVQYAPRRPLLTKNLVIFGGFLLLVIILVALFVSLSNDKKQLKEQVDKLSSGQTATQDQNKKYQDQVSKLVDVPEGVTPAIKVPTSEELAQLIKDNPVYKTTKSGDVFVVYTNSDKSLFVVIYRPSTNKVVLATLGSQTTSPAPAATSTTNKR